MATINQLSAVDAIGTGDLFPLYSQANGDARNAAFSLLLSTIIAAIPSADANKITQYYAPSATAFNFNVNTTSNTSYSNSVWLILTPTGTFATGSITLPPVAGCVDKQEFLMNCTQIVTAFTVNGNGATVTGAPTTLAANATLRLRFDLVTQTWYRV